MEVEEEKVEEKKEVDRNFCYINLLKQRQRQIHLENTFNEPAGAAWVATSSHPLVEVEEKKEDRNFCYINKNKDK